jgi:hypothetical protein
MSEHEYHFGPTAGDASGAPALCHCDGCGCEVGMLTPARQKELRSESEYREGGVLLCRACREGGEWLRDADGRLPWEQ